VCSSNGNRRTQALKEKKLCHCNKHWKHVLYLWLHFHLLCHQPNSTNTLTNLDLCNTKMKTLPSNTQVKLKWLKWQFQFYLTWTGKLKSIPNSLEVEVWLPQTTVEVKINYGTLFILQSHKAMIRMMRTKCNYISYIADFSNNIASSLSWYNRFAIQVLQHCTCWAKMAAG
jgi:hypothetical protein